MENWHRGYAKPRHATLYWLLVLYFVLMFNEMPRHEAMTEVTVSMITIYFARDGQYLHRIAPHIGANLECIG
jgi:hypothetical protein